LDNRLATITGLTILFYNLNLLSHYQPKIFHTEKARDRFFGFFTANIQWMSFRLIAVASGDLRQVSWMAQKQRTVTLLVAPHRIPAPKASMKRSVENHRLKRA
jgi:hypothetical protein